MPTTWRLQTTGIQQVQQRYALAGQRIGSHVLQAVQARLTEAVAYAKERYLTGGTTSDRLAVGRGRLRDAFAFAVTSATRPMTWQLGYLHNPPVYAAVHEGWPGNRISTTIRPTHGQYLAIPLDAARTVGGARRGPRDFPNTFIARSRRGNLLVFQRQGQQIVPLFLLREQVIIPARPALAPTVQRFVPLIVEDIRAAALAAVKG